MKVIAITQKGPNKSENEDRIVVGKSVLADGTLCSEIKEGVIAIADGVGGQNAGAYASQYVAGRLCTINEISDKRMRDINEELIRISETRENLNGMATTLSGVRISESKTQLFGIGNTRVYLLQSGKYLKQLTSDDTTLQYLLAAGQLAPGDAARFDRKNELVACFGGNSPELFKIKIRDTEPFAAPIVLSSDGIHDYLTVDQMEDIIASFGLSEAACKELIRLARENGSSDDASIVFGVV